MSAVLGRRAVMLVRDVLVVGSEVVEVDADVVETEELDALRR